MKRILLVGGTGFVGQSVCERLVEHGEGAGTRITVPTRRLARAKSVQFLPTVDPVECDVHDDAQLARIVAGHDAVVNLIAILHGSAADFARRSLMLRDRVPVGRFGGIPVVATLRRHGGLCADQAEVVARSLARILGEL